MTQFDELIAKLPHDKDLSSVAGVPGSVVYITSADYPCKPDCIACKLPKLVERERALARLEEARWWQGLVCGSGKIRIPPPFDKLAMERILELERAAKQGELAWCWAMKEWVPPGSACSLCGEHRIGGNEYDDPNEQMKRG